MNNKDKITLKNKIFSFFKRTKDIIKENPIFLIYVIGCLLSAMLVRFLTVKNYFGISPILADLIVALLLGSFYFSIKQKNRFKYLLALSIIYVVICIANIVYYHYFNSFISITFISFILANTETGDANVVGNLLQPKFFIVLLFPIFLYFSKKYLDKKEKIESRKVALKLCKKTVLRWTFIIFVLLVITLKGYDYSRLYTLWNREYLVSKFGVYLYQITDIIKSVEPQISTLFGSDKAKKEIEEYYNINKKVKHQNQYTNIFKGKNVIAIHAESIQSSTMAQIFNGKEVTPNLNKLAKEGLYFSNFYSQVGVGTSSDTEFSLATSLYPVNSGTAFVNYADRTYSSFYNLLKKEGYYTFAMHANTGSFWNRDVMYKTLGYDKYYEKGSFIIDEEIGFGLSDKSFFTQAVSYIEEISNTNDKFYGTLIMLTNHTPFDAVESYGEFDLSMSVNGFIYPYMENTKLGNYFKSVHYADEQLGLLIDLLEQKNLLDDTIIVIYGDHDARISKSEWNRLYNYDYLTDDILNEDDPNYKEIDYYSYEINRRVPLIIWSKDETFQKYYSREIDSVMGMVDLSPTLGNMLGIHNPYALGNDIFEILNNNIVVFPNGNFVTDKVYYNDNKNEYKLLKDVPLSENYIKQNIDYSEKILDISNKIVVYNYFYEKLSDKKYNNENKLEVN